MLEIGTLLEGKYKILSEIGHGGMSNVYLALDVRANKTWAVKEVRKSADTDYEAVRQGLIAETSILKRLDNPHLPRIADVLDHDDFFIIVMDYVEGQDLQRRIMRAGTPMWEAVVDWSLQLLDVLEYLHGQRPPIIYRDLKPSNIMLRKVEDTVRYPWGMVILLDFGTAREYKGKGAREDTNVLGTRGFAAPEQYGGLGESDGRTDIYNLGATMYTLLTGHLPDEPPTYAMLPIRQWDPRLPAELEAVVIKATAQAKQDRYQTAAEMRRALLKIIKAPAVRYGGRRPQGGSGRKLFPYAAVVTVLLCAAALAFLGRGTVFWCFAIPAAIGLAATVILLFYELTNPGRAARAAAQPEVPQNVQRAHTYTMGFRARTTALLKKPPREVSGFTVVREIMVINSQERIL